MSDLKVSDEEYAELARSYRQYGSTDEIFLERYCTYLSVICTSGIKSGLIHDNLSLFSSQAQLLRGQMTEVTEALAVSCEEYAAKIDELDQYLY